MKLLGFLFCFVFLNVHICTRGRIYPSLASCFVYGCKLQYHSYIGGCSATNCTPAPLPTAPAACGERGGPLTFLGSLNVTVVQNRGKHLEKVKNGLSG